MKQELPEVTISYLKVAAPISPHQVLKDIRSLEHGREPDALIMWQHQLDWIARQLQASGTRTFFKFDVSVTDMCAEPRRWLEPMHAVKERAVIDKFEGTLFGVPVRVENPL